MIKIIAGGKKHAKWLQEACAEYEKRLRKPFNVEWLFVDEERIAEKVARLDNDVFAIAKGQICVIYDEKNSFLISGGIIEKII